MKEKFSKWKWRERKREKCSFSDNGFDLFLGWIRKRNDNSCEIIGWMEAQKRAEKNISQAKLKTKKHFEGLNQFFFRFFLLLAFSDFIRHDNDKDDVRNWVDKKITEGLLVKY